MLNEIKKIELGCYGQRTLKYMHSKIWYNKEDFNKNVKYLKLFK